MYKKALIILTACIVVAFCLADTQIGTDTEKSYGSVVVDNVLSVNDGLTFRCDINQWPAVLGRDIPIRINAVAPIPAETAGDIENNGSEAKKFIETAFAKAKIIILKNIRRGETFSIVADVIIDGRGLADMLIEKALAKKTTAKQSCQVSFNKTAADDEDKPAPPAAKPLYLASKNSKIFHYHTCRSAGTISAKNIVNFGTKDQALRTSRRPCKICNP